MIDIKPLENETVEEYTRRLAGCKIEYKLSWEQIASLVANHYSRFYGRDWYRVHYTEFINATHCSSGSIRTEEIPETEVVQMVDSNIEDVIRNQRRMLRDERIQINAHLRQYDRERSFIDIAQECAEELSKAYTPIVFTDTPKPTERGVEGILQLSDWHYGIDHDSCFNKYNPDICKDRVAELYRQTMNWVKQYDINKLYIANLGDMISGLIHSQIRIQNRYDVVTQTQNVALIIEQLIDEFCKQGLFVEYHDCTDNHSRVNANLHESVRIESFQRFIPWYLETAFRGSDRFKYVPNVLRDDLLSFDVLGHPVVGAHGDQRKDKENNFSNVIVTMTRQFYDIYLLAHVHTPAYSNKNNNHIIVNGALSGVDDYAESLRFSNTPSQNFIAVTKENPVYAIHQLAL